MRNLGILFYLILSVGVQAQDVSIQNDRIIRTLSFDGKVWRTVKFSNIKGDISIAVKSDEFNILPLNSEESISITDFSVNGKPSSYKIGDTTFLQIHYTPLSKIKSNPATPKMVSIKYFAIKGENFIRKNISLLYNKEATVDRLEVERLVVDKVAKGGGRGEPVFVDGNWFLGLEYPASYSRHTDGNTPVSYSRHYDKAGNYSFINLEGRDIEPNAEKGMIRLMHFPGYTIKTSKGGYQINSKKSVVGFSENNQNLNQAFQNYLSTIWKAPRSFLHYNNWFDKEAKDLKGEGFINVYKKYKAAIEPYGVKLDAMVPDDGWQNKESIWQPTPKYFPNGDDDLKVLSKKLKEEGVNLGLWLSLNSYTNKIDWGVKNGYKEAKRNDYFGRYGRYYSLSGTKYKTELLQRLPYLAEKADVVYFKHDFNDLCDMGEGNNHPATDRHGHEASVDVTIELLLATKKVKPEIYQNLTNWIWFSPWWLQYADYLWMLAGDDGLNENTPELSVKAMSTIDRDTYIWRNYGKENDRPLVPISRLMTHGIIKNVDGPMEGKNETLQDWMDYVLMHYGRGTLLKEWYISVNAMSPEQWKALCNVHNWAKKNQNQLINTVFVGGRPDEGNAYGYIGWNEGKAVLVARNTSAFAQKLVIPFDERANFFGVKGVDYHANVVYPYRDAYPATFTSGKDIEITLPGYATMAFEFEKGASIAAEKIVPAIDYTTVKSATMPLKTVVTLPADVKGRCDLLLIGYPKLPVIKINGKEATIKCSSKAKINNFASYAIEGMPSGKAKDWNMASIDLLPFAGKKIEITYNETDGVGLESYVLTERKVEALNNNNGADELWPITNDTRRQTVRLF